MTKYRTDYFGKWEIRERDETLIEPSAEYLTELEEEKKEMKARSEIESEKLQRISVLKEKCKNKIATLKEIQELLSLI